MNYFDGVGQFPRGSGSVYLLVGVMIAPLIAKVKFFKVLGQEMRSPKRLWW